MSVNLIEIFGQPFDASQVDPSGVGGQLPVSGPEGLEVVIVSSQMKPAKQEGNYFVELTLQVRSGPNSGEEGIHRLNLVNASDQAVKSAQRELSSLCRVTGVWNPSDMLELHGIPFRVITVEKHYTGSDGKEYTGSEVKKFLDANGNPAVTDSTSAPVQSAAKPSFAPASKAAPATAPSPKTGWKPNPAAPATGGEQPSWMKAKK